MLHRVAFRRVRIEDMRAVREVIADDQVEMTVAIHIRLGRRVAEPPLLVGDNLLREEACWTEAPGRVRPAEEDHRRTTPEIHQQLCLWSLGEVARQAAHRRHRRIVVEAREIKSEWRIAGAAARDRRHDHAVGAGVHEASVVRDPLPSMSANATAAPTAEIQETICAKFGLTGRKVSMGGPGGTGNGVATKRNRVASAARSELDTDGSWASWYSARSTNTAQIRLAFLRKSCRAGLMLIPSWIAPRAGA